MTGDQDTRSPDYRSLITGHRNGANRIRTGDPLLAKQVLYQLSYGPGEEIPDPDRSLPADRQGDHDAIEPC